MMDRACPICRRGDRLYNLRMDLKQLRAILAIAETASVTRAAEALHVVQPALSRQLKMLEEELGVSLFDRERHGMVLTVAGRRFAESARRALHELDSARAAISPRSQQVAGTVVVGFFPSAADRLVSSLMGRVRQAYPHVQVCSYVSYLADLEQRLEKGGVDGALVYGQEEISVRFPRDALLEEAFYLVGAPDAELDMNTPVPLRQFREVPMILPARPHTVRELLDRECAAHGFALNVAAETHSMHAQKAMVMSGVGLSILSGFVIADELGRGQVSAAPIASLNLRRKLYLARSAGTASTTVAECVLEELRDEVRQRVLQGRWPGGTLLS